MNEAEPNQVTEPVESPEQAAVSEPPAEPKKKAGKGNILLSQIVSLRFWIFVCILCVLYIAKRNYYYKLWREAQVLEEEVKDLRNESITLTAELMRMSRESDISKRVKEQNLDLEESHRPPIRIPYRER
ncbi:MAG: FtsL-like putative cell division protein [Bacteroides sp.]